MKKKYPSVIILTGRMGSGKSTLVSALARELGYAEADGGTIRRAMASELGMTIEEFSEYGKKHPEYDKETDRRLLALVKKGHVVMQSRVLPYLKEIQEMSDVALLYLFCSKEERARRISRRESISLRQALRNIALRDHNDDIRYKKFYGIDISKHDMYDVEVNNSHLTPKETLKVALDKLTTL